MSLAVSQQRALHNVRPHGASDSCARRLHVCVTGIVIFLSLGAHSQNECGPAVAGGSVTCNSSTYTTGPADSIFYGGVDGLTVTVDALTVRLPPYADPPTNSVVSPSEQVVDVNITDAAATGAIVVNASGVVFESGDPASPSASGSNTLPGRFGDAIRAEQRGQGALTVNVDGGVSITTSGWNAAGAYAWQRNANPNNSSPISLSFDGATSQIVTNGGVSAGIFGRTDGGLGNTTVTASGGRIATFGSRSVGIRALNVGQIAGAAGDVVVSATNVSVETRGNNAIAVSAENQSAGGDADNRVLGGEIRTLGTASGSHGISSVVTAGAGDAFASVGSGAVVATVGPDSYGIQAISQGTGDAEVDVGNSTISAGGSNAAAVLANSTAGTSSISLTGNVLGGTASASGIATVSALGSTVNVGVGGTVRSLADVAVLASGGATVLRNDGAMIGAVALGVGDDTFQNNSSNSWNIRNFSDTTSNGVRDTLAVAISDFGAGADTFTNSALGLLRLGTVPDAAASTSFSDDDQPPATVDTAGELVNGFGIARSVSTAGVEQGHLVNLERFEHGGVITMADTETGGASPVAGDVLVVTAASSAGAGGAGRYVSNGGELRLDAVLNAGGAASEADLLVVDNVEVGSGPTQVVVANAALGAGASTDTNANGVVDASEGILLIEVLGDSPSAAFTMTPIVDSGFQYVLAQGTDGNWYLQSDAIAGGRGTSAAHAVPALSNVLLLSLMLLMLITVRLRLGPSRSMSHVG